MSVSCLLRLAAGLLLATAVAMPASAQSPVVERDHLKCYKIKDSRNPQFAPAVQRLENQFHVESDCQVRPMARYLCAETAKNDGNDVRGGPAGHFLCYKIKCATESKPVKKLGFTVDDQAGVRRIELVHEELVCTPVDKYICGDGDIDPPEECDGNTCPDGQACQADCKCPPPLPCHLDTTQDPPACTGSCPSGQATACLWNGTDCVCVPQSMACAISCSPVTSCERPDLTCQSGPGGCACVP